MADARPALASSATGPPPAEGGATPRLPALLRGRALAPGLAVGPARLAHWGRGDWGLLAARPGRVPREEVEHELNRFQRSLAESRRQLLELRSRLRGTPAQDHAEILDAHASCLKDPVFLSDVESLILREQMSLEGAVAKVAADFDRIFRLVEGGALRERAVDLRDVGLRVLRNLEIVDARDGQTPGEVGERVRPERVAPCGGHVLVCRELSIADLLEAAGEGVRGIAIEADGLSTQAAALARSLGIPTVAGLGGLLAEVSEGDPVILDADEGVLCARSGPDAAHPAGDGPAGSPLVRTADGAPVTLYAACGSLAEVEAAARWGASGVGPYRTPLPSVPGDEASRVAILVAHYGAVLAGAGGEVTFLLLGGDLARAQLEALLRAARVRPGALLRVAVPGAIDCDVLRRARELLLQVRLDLRAAGRSTGTPPALGVVLETPAAAIGVADLAREADFLSVGLDGLQRTILVDQGHAPPARLHPFVLRALRRVVEVCEAAGTPLDVFGAGVAAPANAALLLGLGLRRLATAPADLERLAQAVTSTALDPARRAAAAACEACGSAEPARGEDF